MLLVFVVSTMRKLLEDPRNRTCMQNFAQNCFFPKMAPLFYSTIFSRLFVNSTNFFWINFRSRWYTWYMSLRGIYLHACMHALHLLSITSPTLYDVAFTRMSNGGRDSWAATPCPVGNISAHAPSGGPME